MPEIVKLAENVTLYCGECAEVLPTLDPVSAVVTDPPYGLSFMGKAWDYDIPGADTWAAVSRALRPGGLNIDAARVPFEGESPGGSGNGSEESVFSQVKNSAGNGGNCTPIGGRWPANVIHDGSSEVLQCFPEGSARFFYTAKASRAERDMGCENMAEKVAPKLCDTGYGSDKRMDGAPCAKYRNHHLTIKPVDLMRYLVRLVTPPGAVVLDPFMGSGTTGVAAVEQGFGFIGIEREPEYFLIAVARVEKALQQGVLGI